MKTRLFLLTLLFVFSAQLFAQVDSSAAPIPEPAEEPTVELYKPFALNIALDASLFVIGGAEWAYRLYTSHQDKDEWDGTLYDKSDINAFDRWAARKYSSALDNAGTVGTALAVALPLFSVYASGDWLTEGVMFAETMLVASGTYSVIKSFVKRNRPYMYFDGGSTSDMEDGDYENSFPSGHTTNAFAAAVFAGYTFSVYNPDSNLKIPVWIAGLSVASATGVLRVLSGNHFPSDVLAGAALGSLTGFLVPYLHLKQNIFSKNVEISALPAGALVKVRF